MHILSSDFSDIYNMLNIFKKNNVFAIVFFIFFRPFYILLRSHPQIRNRKAV